ncbi:MAG: ABC transporter ATP-binding protein [Deltaproteobacteria bacterium]|nr:ABC transporter ATP-binding protein [Deltaproteobacteria bacterium]
MTTVRPILSIDGISKSYPVGFTRKRHRVLYDLSFAVCENEIVGFLGPNGAGKTTTIKIVNRLSFPDEGEVTVFGERIGRRPEFHRRIGFMPEQPYFYEYLTGVEFLGLCGSLSGMRKTAIAVRSRSMLARVGLEGAGKTAIRKYSKGMMQRLGLAQALLHDPELVILDEPMSGLDPMGRLDVRNLILELKAAGKTVFFSTHIISDVEALCDRVIMIDKGRKVAEGSVEELMGGEGVQYVEIVISPVPSSGWISAAGLPPAAGAVRGNTFVLKAGSVEEANRWIDGFRRAGSMVVSCVPVKKHLEEIYVERVGGRG